MTGASLGVRAVRASVALFAVALALGWATHAVAAPRKPRAAVPYDLDLLGFNDGSPYALHGVEAEAVLGAPGAELFQLADIDWMRAEPREGSYVPVLDVTGRYPERQASELVAVFEVDLEGDRDPEILLVPSPDTTSRTRRYAPTLLRLRGERYRAVWAANALPGERYRVVDIRDLNADSRPEILLSGESGHSGPYQFHELVARGAKGVVSLPVKHVNSLHFVDLDADGKLEIVVRERVGHRGPADQWTYVDRLHQWTGTRFVSADEKYPRYHDQQTLPTLLGDILDNYAAKKPLLMEKVEAIQAVRTQVLSWTRKPRKFKTRKRKALSHLKLRRPQKAEAALRALDASYPYDVRVLVGLAELRAAAEEWNDVLEYSTRALTVEPTSREGWWWAGVAFSQLSERSAAVGSLYSAVALCGPSKDGTAFLEAQRGKPGMDAQLQAVIDEVLAELKTE